MFEPMRSLHRKLHFILFIFAVLGLTGCALGRGAPGPAKVFDQAAALIEKNYIDKSGNPVKLDTSMRPDISTLIAQTDATTILLTPEDIETLRNPSGGGIGVVLGLKNGAYEIIKPLPGSPAQKAGLRRGDKIPEINGAATGELPINKVVHLLQGAPGTEVVLKVEEKSGTRKEMTLTRAVIKIQGTAARRLGEKNIVYIRIEQFLSEAATEVRTAMKRFGENDIKGLVVDLRNNGGGLLDSITGVAELFMKQNEIIATLGGRYDGQEKELTASKWSPYPGFPIIVLIDGKTSSGAEILAAALRDNKHALLVGERSAGICDIQTAYPLKDGSQIRLRTAFALTTAGARVDGQGVTPDNVVVLSEEERENIYTRMELFPDLNYTASPADIQLQAAVALLTENVKN